MKHVILGAALAIMSTPLVAETRTVVRPPIKTESNLTQQGNVVLQSSAHTAADVGAEPLSKAVDNVAPVSKYAGAKIEPPRFDTALRPPVRIVDIPRTRWQHMQGHQMWTRVALAALKTHGEPLVDLVPADIETWCPAYATAPDQDRRAFWVGFLSALAKYESTYKPWAVGGGGKWYGLLQILPGTARGYKCNASTGAALKNGGANLSCAIRIMAVTVPRDGVIYGRGGRGVAADWGPMRSAAKRRDMAGWLRQQNYCRSVSATRPQSRP